jgi:UDP-glucose 4-epimerase
MTQTSILVTGGAGYIGSHILKLLGERNENIVVLDDLSTGFEDAILHGTFINGNTGDKELVRTILKEHNEESVLHFAAINEGNGAPISI